MAEITQGAPTSRWAVQKSVNTPTTMCCTPVGRAKLRTHQPSALLYDETSSDTSYLSRRMLRLLLSAAPVQGSDGTVRITMLTPARKRRLGPGER